VIGNLIKPYISRTLSIDRSELEDKSNKSSPEFTFLHALAQSGQSEKKIHDEIVNLLFAGRDTTAATLSWLFYELARNPEVMGKIRAEIQEILGYNCIARPPKLDELKRMKYLQRTVDEILRLYPPVPFNIRFALQDAVITTSTSKHPLAIRKGDAVVYSTLALHRREDLYPRPSESFAEVNIFSPERWEKWTPTPWQYIPFNGGPRICVGQRFALTEIYYTVVRIFQNFSSLEWDHGGSEEQFMRTEIVGQ
jgi:cytochrome P450